jgi:hypothetical protein
MVFCIKKGDCGTRGASAWIHLFLWRPDTGTLPLPDRRTIEKENILLFVVCLVLDYGMMTFK